MSADRLKALAGIIGDDDEEMDDIFSNLADKRDLFEKPKAYADETKAEDNVAVVPKKMVLKKTVVQGHTITATPAAASSVSSPSVEAKADQRKSGIVNQPINPTEMMRNRLKPRPSQLGKPRLVQQAPKNNNELDTPSNDSAYIGDVVHEHESTAETAATVTEITNEQDKVNKDDVSNEINKLDEDDAMKGIVFGRPRTFGAAGGEITDYHPNVIERAAAISHWKLFKKDKNGHARAMEWRTTNSASNEGSKSWGDDEDDGLSPTNSVGSGGGFGAVKKSSAPPSFLAQFERHQSFDEENSVNGVPTPRASTPRKATASPRIGMLSPRNAVMPRSPRVSSSPRNNAVGFGFGNAPTPSPRNTKGTKAVSKKIKPGFLSHFEEDEDEEDKVENKSYGKPSPRNTMPPSSGHGDKSNGQVLSQKKVVSSQPNNSATPLSPKQSALPSPTMTKFKVKTSNTPSFLSQQQINKDDAESKNPSSMRMASPRNKPPMSPRTTTLRNSGSKTPRGSKTPDFKQPKSSFFAEENSSAITSPMSKPPTTPGKMATPRNYENQNAKPFNDSRTPRGYNLSVQNGNLEPSPAVSSIDEDEQRISVKSVLRTPRGYMMSMQAGGDLKLVESELEDGGSFDEEERQHIMTLQSSVRTPQGYMLSMQNGQLKPKEGLEAIKDVNVGVNEQAQVMEEAINFLKTPRGRHIMVDSVKYDVSALTDVSADQFNHTIPSQGLTDEECENELEMAKQLALELNRFLIDDDQNANLVSGVSEFGQGNGRMVGEKCSTVDEDNDFSSECMMSYSEEMEQIREPFDTAMDQRGCIVEANQQVEFQETNYHGAQDENGFFVNNDRHDEPNGKEDDWEAWVETPKNIKMVDDDGFSLPATFVDGNKYGFHDAALPAVAEDSAMMNEITGFETFSPTSGDQCEGEDEFLFPSSFGLGEPNESQEVDQSQPRKANLTVATSFDSSTTPNKVHKKAQKIKVSIDGAPQFRPTEKKPDEELFFIAQPSASPRCGDDAQLLTDQSSSLAPTPKESNGTESSSSNQMVKGIGRINIKGFINSAWPALNHDALEKKGPQSPSVAGLLAAPSYEEKETNAVDNNSPEGLFYAAPATPTNNAYTQISINRGDTSEKKSVFLNAGKSAFSRQLRNEEEPPVNSTAKKSKNLLRRIKNPLLGRNKRRGTFGSLNGDSLPSNN